MKLLALLIWVIVSFLAVCFLVSVVAAWFAVGAIENEEDER